jgi:putative spermidine/putrescine transport system substrate-binding protein
MTETVMEPFEQEFDSELTLALPGGSTEILARLRAEKDNPTLDVVLIGGALEKTAAAEGLMEEVDWAEEAPNWNDLISEAKDVPGYGPSIAMSGIGMIYNTEKMPFEPSSWYDFWDPRLSDGGLIGVFNMDANYTLALTSLLNDHEGGTEDNVDPAFEKWKELMESHAPLILDSSQDVVDSIAQRDAWMVFGPNSRALSMAKEGLPVSIEYPEEGGFIWGNYAGIPKGSKNRDLAVEFINFYLRPEIQADWATCVGYSPTNQNTDLGDYEYKDALIVDNVFELDWEYINEHRAEWIERWNTEVLPVLNQ